MPVIFSQRQVYSGVLSTYSTEERVCDGRGMTYAAIEPSSKKVTGKCQTVKHSRTVAKI